MPILQFVHMYIHTYNTRMENCILQCNRLHIKTSEYSPSSVDSTPFSTLRSYTPEISSTIAMFIDIPLGVSSLILLFAIESLASPVPALSPNYGHTSKLSDMDEVMATTCCDPQKVRCCIPLRM